MGGCNGSDRTKEIPRGSITTYEEFFAKVASGAKLIVLDDAVIDINSFEAIHPGGKDALEKYVGTLLRFLTLHRHGSQSVLLWWIPDAGEGAAFPRVQRI